MPGINQTREAMKASFGGFGGQYVDDTVARTPTNGLKFVAIQVLETAVMTLVGNITGITAVTVTAGNIIYGEYSSVTLASGVVIAYQGGVKTS